MSLEPPKQLKGPQLELLGRQYDEMQRNEAWKDFVSRLAVRRAAIVSELILPRLRNADRSDEFLRACLLAIDTVLDIPIQIRHSYDDMHAQAALRERIIERGTGGKDWAGIAP